MKKQYQIGDSVEFHKNWVYGTCLVCARQLSDDSDLKVALNDRLQILSFEQLQQLSENMIFSEYVGAECAKKFPKESLYQDN